MREAFRSRIRIMPSDLSIPSAAATWPCGRDLRMDTASSRDRNTTPPARKARIASTRAGGILERFATVLLRMRFPSRHASRRRMAGGEVRFGITSTPRATALFLYMATTIQD